MEVFESGLGVEDLKRARRESRDRIRSSSRDRFLNLSFGRHLQQAVDSCVRVEIIGGIRSSADDDLSATTMTERSASRVQMTCCYGGVMMK